MAEGMGTAAPERAHVSERRGGVRSTCPEYDLIMWLLVQGVCGKIEKEIQSGQWHDSTS